MISKKHKKVCATPIIEHFFNLASTIIECISISALASLIGIPMGITSSEIALKICVIVAGMKKYKSIIKKKEHDKIVLLAKSELNSTENLVEKIQEIKVQKL